VLGMSRPEVWLADALGRKRGRIIGWGDGRWRGRARHSSRTPG
jgi:hypothetical protein